jgi:hypothetical protein
MASTVPAASARKILVLIRSRSVSNYSEREPRVDPDFAHSLTLPPKALRPWE